MGRFWATDDKGRHRETQEGRRKKANERKARREEYLAGKVCAVCGETGTTVAWLPEVKPQPFSTAIVWTYHGARREDYLEFTWVLCREHFNKTRGGGRTITEHGGGRMGVKDCHCDLCTERRRTTRAEWHRRYRERRVAHKQAVEKKKEKKK